MNITATLFAQAAVFALFIAFTVKFIWPYMLRAIEARQKTIADGLAPVARDLNEAGRGFARTGARPRRRDPVAGRKARRAADR
jgi:F-type H+-transporting ATPase subunit b